VEPGTLRFGVEKGKIRWGTYFRDLMRPRFGGGFESYSGGGSSVVAQNSHGEKHVIAVFKTLQQAKDNAVIVESDFRTLGATAWCERYNVPLSFVSG
jgi:hypothetical protein